MPVRLDHKTKSLVCALQGGAATHWCELCDYNRNDGDGKEVDLATLRTFEQLHHDAAGYKAQCDMFELYEAAMAKWRTAGSTVGSRPQRVTKPRARDFNNVHRPPMPFLPTDGTVVWVVIPPCPLHLTINVVSRCVYSAMTDHDSEEQYIEDTLHLKMFAQRSEWDGRKCLHH